MTKKEKNTLEGIEIPDWYLLLESEIIEILALEEQIKSRKERLQTTILTMMEQGNIDAIKSGLTSASRTKPTEVHKFDATRFKAEKPEEYESYCKVFSRSGSVTLRWLKQPSSEAI